MGDTSFMSAVGDTRVLPESLTDTYRRVKKAWEAFEKQEQEFLVGEN